MGSVSEFNFTLKAIKKLFMAKTIDQRLFGKDKKVEDLQKSGEVKDKLSQKLSNIKKIDFSAG